MSEKPTDENIAFVRSQIEYILEECEWLWNEDLTQLEDLPQIEGRDLAGHRVPSLKEELTDRERACYLLGQVNGYAHAGSAIEESLELDYSDVDTSIDVDEYDKPIGAFWTPEDEPNGEFYNDYAW